MIKLVSFDVWNTLLDLDKFLEEIARELSIITRIDEEKVAATLYSVRKEVKELRVSGKISINEVLELSQDMIAELLNIDVEVVKRGIARATIYIDPRELAIDGARNVLRKLKEQDLIIITIGNIMIWPSSYTRLLLEKTDLAWFIDKQFYADEIGVFKPFKEAFLKPLAIYGVQPNEAIHVGDSYKEDLLGAWEAGLYSVRIDNAIEDIIEEDERRYIVPSLKKIPELIKALR
ncbi:MAG: HAD family hydrolase [Desulfurococcales archaeon]|nr:HAD family hydrolase [Desulfurococcales archaeon]